MKLPIEADGSVRLPAALLERWGISAGRTVEASVEKGRLVLRPLGVEGDPFAAGIRPPDPEGFEKVLRRDAEHRAKARDAFDRAMKEKHDIDMEKEREERERWL
jgi:bifunctional DNA-binding transcriptional regulator/antitoxin component of YhaV-PrlF toxin-antitoxin module